MRYFRFLFAALCMVLILASTARSQVSIVWKETSYLFYNTPDLKKLDLNIQGKSEQQIADYQTKAADSDVVKKARIKKNDDGYVLSLSFKSAPGPDQIKTLFEAMGITEFTVNGKMILTETLISVEEARQIAGNMKLVKLNFRAEYNDPANPEHYDYEVFYAKSKLHHMLNGDFVKYLYDGYIAQYVLKYKQAKADLEDFNNAYNNK